MTLDPEDAGVPAFWSGLGLPGLIDVHVHFLPPRVSEKVFAYFDAAEAHYGRPWPIRYRRPEPERVAYLGALGVRHFTGLVYPHKPDMAEWLSGWALDFAARTPGCVPSATFYPEPSATRYVRAAIEAGARVFKVHVQVGGFDPADPLLDPVWGLLAEAGRPAIVHCGDGPMPGPFTGLERFEAVLRRHPRLVAVIAHAGLPDYAGFLGLVERYPNVHLDTTMVGTAYMNAVAPIPPDVVRRYGELGDRIVLGSDFPSIPYAYADQLAALESWGHGAEWLRAVCWHNGARLLEVNVR